MDFLNLILSILAWLAAPIIVIWSTIWVYRDAKKYQQSGIATTPWLWSLLTLLIWFPIFFIYLIVKYSVYNKK